MDPLNNIACIKAELDWLAWRIDSLLNKGTGETLSLPALKADTAYEKLVSAYGLNESERVMLNFALASLFKPALLTPFTLHFKTVEKKAAFGGLLRDETGDFVPTIRTGIFLLSGEDVEMTDYHLRHFNKRNKLFTSNILLAFPTRESRAFPDEELHFNEQFLATILQGLPPVLDGDSGFPARRSKRTHTMKDVVLDQKTVVELDKLRRFARNMTKLWALPNSSHYRQNFIGVFSGDPGTGKSHTAEAIGNELNLPVYKVNFAQLVSKYIGETEKNLERVFDRFSGQPSILFFDEAESIFSKRIEVKDSHDKHSNNEQSYLLQKIEEYNGIVILATNVQNLAQYFDKAFQRRIRQIVNFNFPDYPERLRLWQNALRSPFQYEEGLVDKLAMNYQLSGGGIYNIISEGIIEALDRNEETIRFELLETAMMDEFKKTGRKYEICKDEMVVQNPIRRYGPGYEHRRNF
jgi:AAA+ superfamily predicted ATPase